jgi:hypothetical protein
MKSHIWYVGELEKTQLVGTTSKLDDLGWVFLPFLQAALFFPGAKNRTAKRG